MLPRAKSTNPNIFQVHDPEDTIPSTTLPFLNAAMKEYTLKVSKLNTRAFSFPGLLLTINERARRSGVNMSATLGTLFCYL